MCRSPFASMSRSSMAWRATWSSMCSRKGSPVDSLASPLPSTLSRTRIWVSLVLRTTSEVRMSKRFPEGGKQYTVFVGRADRDTQAVAQSWMQILHQHALPLQRFVGPVCLRHTHQKKISLRRKHRYTGEAGEGRAERCALGPDPRRLLFEHLEPLQHEKRSRLGEHIDVVGLPYFVELLDPLRPAGEIAQADAGQTELRHRAQDDQVRMLAEALHEGPAGEHVIRLIQDDESFGGADHPQDIFFRIQGACGIIRIGDEHERRPLAFHAREERVGVE